MCSMNSNTSIFLDNQKDFTNKSVNYFGSYGQDLERKTVFIASKNMEGNHWHVADALTLIR